MADVQELNINNSTYNIKAKSVVDTNSGKLKFWSGTRVEYDALVSGGTVDADTIYSIYDDTDTTLTLLELLYPVGSIYIGTMATCPLATLGVGTWQLVAVDRVLQGAGSGTVGSTVEAGLPNITGTVGGVVTDSITISGAFKSTNSTTYFAGGGGSRATSVLDASRSSSIYGNSTTVQPPAYLVNIWERVS